MPNKPKVSSLNKFRVASLKLSGMTSFIELTIDFFVSSLVKCVVQLLGTLEKSIESRDTVKIKKLKESKTKN